MYNISAMWVYWADFDPDLNKVLQKARQDVFESGDYFLAERPELTWLGDPVDPDNVTDPRIPPPHLEWIRQIKSMGDRPRTMEELLDWNVEEGTRSIIDISTIGDTLQTGKSSCAAPDNLLQKWFGSTKPTREMIEKKLDSLFMLTDRGSAVHVVIFEGEKPTQVVFVGNTVD